MAHAERFMWDDAMFPVSYPAAFPADLATELQAWSDEGSQRLPSEASGSDWPASWFDRGRSLAQEAARVLKRPVEYRNEATDEKELIAPPKNAPPTHRHGRPRSS